jgi:aldose 1-epimerase
MMGTGEVSVRPIGRLSTGETISAVELSNEYMQVTLLDLGASLWTLKPHGHASARGITLAHNDPLSYAANPPYLGCTVGPLANRVGKSAFVLDGQRYDLTPNEGAHHLHGGPTGFSHRVWGVEPDHQATEVVFRLHRSDGDGGYPGNLDVAVTWTLERNCLRFAWSASADKATPVSITNHTYWNLSGSGTIEDHLLRVDAEAFVEIDGDLIPRGALVPSSGSVFDLANLTRVGDAIERVGFGGIDHCYALVPDGRIELREPGSGLSLVMETSLPGLQVYTGHQLDASPEQGGFQPMAGLCLETQFFPDAVNNPSYPSPLVGPEELVHHWTTYTFNGIRPTGPN